MEIISWIKWEKTGEKEKFSEIVNKFPDEFNAIAEVMKEFKLDHSTATRAYYMYKERMIKN